ncbi:MAG: trypsin-like serine protease, partial [bacterium]|nr:trypsin-like serine protease [bacterium]
MTTPQTYTGDISLQHFAVAMALLGMAFLQTATSGEVEQTGIAPRIVNGLFTSNHPTTGALLIGETPQTAETWCSGTLIGCGTFVTAAHCVEDYPNPSEYTVFLQHAGLFSVESITPHPDYNFPVA